MTVALWAAEGSAADQSSVGLPEVNVTAPPITPQYKKWSPYLGNMRVEENKWPTIPCTGSRIAAAAAGNMQDRAANEPGGARYAARSVVGPNIELQHRS